MFTNQRFLILELYDDNDDHYSSREVFEELAPYVGGDDPDELTLTTHTVTLTHIEGTAFYLVPVTLTPPNKMQPARGLKISLEDMKAALSKWKP